MAFEDGYYYGQCKLIVEAETVDDNGHSVSVRRVADGKTWTGTIDNKLCTFVLPPRDLYEITLMGASTAKWVGTVELGYGECRHVMLADGYAPIVENRALTLDEIRAKENAKGYITDASATKELDANLTANNGETDVPFKFAFEGGRYGYKVGADTFLPFKSNKKFIAASTSNGKLEFNEAGTKYYNMSFIIIDISDKQYFSTQNIVVGGVTGAPIIPVEQILEFKKDDQYYVRVFCTKDIERVSQYYTFQASWGAVPSGTSTSTWRQYLLAFADE